MPGNSALSCSVWCVDLGDVRSWACGETSRWHDARGFGFVLGGKGSPSLPDSPSRMPFVARLPAPAWPDEQSRCPDVEEVLHHRRGVHRAPADGPLDAGEASRAAPQLLYARLPRERSRALWGVSRIWWQLTCPILSPAVDFPALPPQPPPEAAASSR